MHVHSSGKRGTKVYNQDRYYITSLTDRKAQYYARGIRSHWHIENKLHWVKDVILNEDKSGIKSGLLAANLSLVKSAIIALIKINNYQSIKKALEMFANRPEKSYLLLENNHI